MSNPDGVPDGRFSMTIPVREPGWTHPVAAAVPEEQRDLHELYARTNGFFRLPCPLCDKPFGGHEWRNIEGKESSIPDPFEPEGSGMAIGICPACTRAGRGVEVTPRGAASLLPEASYLPEAGPDR